MIESRARQESEHPDPDRASYRALRATPVVEGAPQAADRRRLESVGRIRLAAAGREVGEAVVSWMGQRNSRPLVRRWMQMGEPVAGLVLLHSMTMTERSAAGAVASAAGAVSTAAGASQLTKCTLGGGGASGRYCVSPHLALQGQSPQLWARTGLHNLSGNSTSVSPTFAA